MTDVQWKDETPTLNDWRYNKEAGAVIADQQAQFTCQGDVDYYGGYVVCETVTDVNARLIVAACNSFQQNCGEHAIYHAETNLLGEALDTIRRLVKLDGKETDPTKDLEYVKGLGWAVLAKLEGEGS